jgi:predicted ester cyclase
MIDQLYAANFTQHEPAPPVPVNSAADLKRYVGMYCTALPDLHFTIDDLVAEGDRVVWRFTSRGTQRGEMMGISPTGKTATVTGIVIFRLENSRIAEAWVNIDTLGLLQSLGVIPMLAPTGH